MKYGNRDKNGDYRIFISFSHTKGTGSICIRSKMPVEQYIGSDDIERYIQQNHLENVVILNWRYL